ncbi:alpha/beta-hydrolase [Pseudovirgaria hyperparasitica]|uniref:Alpha/beta-hydrolase n=1 Tax=Pseudovirgaria hyperparasitica TaxID=470096 RepID=A0A6A6W0A9_9PEZI|nr:alpha/beta-hydrolase [Pseudovirgaria hyperparasitica]KAF2754501.1 alpha/beta-hydrolase [Pseudovirgaria hyperparasitica]
MRSFISIPLLAGLAASSTIPASPVDARDAAAAPSFAPIKSQEDLSKALNDLYTDAQYLGLGAVAGAALLNAIVPLASPNSTAELAEDFKKITAANPKDIFEYGAQIILNGFSGQDFLTIFNAYVATQTTSTSAAQPAPSTPKPTPATPPTTSPSPTSAKQSTSPPDFTYGRIPPVIFLPGTAALAGQNFGPNYGKLLKRDNIADPVYLNLPGQNLADIQGAAEYTAYAINYISAISNNVNVSTISWSAGSLDSQWAFKYWPSTRSRVSDAIRLSADLHGTVFARLLCPGFTTPGCTPAIAQQEYDSKFINVLRANGGDSAYVPTTSIYSIFDEIVQPQSDPIASAASLDARGVGVTNVELQSVCTALLPGGLPINDHEGVIINALGYELAKDALTHAGPGQLSRVDTNMACERFAADGLSLADIFATYALIPIAALNILAFQPKADGEPPIKAYAANGQAP